MRGVRVPSTASDTINVSEDKGLSRTWILKRPAFVFATCTAASGFWCIKCKLKGKIIQTFTVGGGTMSIQIILWSMLIIPWLTLLFMKKEDVKRFMAVTLFAIVTGLLINDIAETLNLFIVRQTVFPLSHTMPYALSLFPVATIWVFRFTYGRFWLYMTANLVLDLFFNLLIMPLILKMGILEQNNFSTYKGLLLTLVHAVLLYGYQLWQEDALGPAVKKIFSTRLQPAAAKTIIKDEDDNDNSR
jgi:hypothetical protein